jgi:hypothetical protein
MKLMCDVEFGLLGSNAMWLVGRFQNFGDAGSKLLRNAGIFLRRYNPENQRRRFHRREDLRSHLVNLMYDFLLSD